MIVPEEETPRHVILFHLLAVDVYGEEHWIQNEFVFDSEDDIEYKRTLNHITTLEKEGTVRNLKLTLRTTAQEWHF
jgi:hypothetical protein